MDKITSSEQLIRFMISNLNLGRNDERFLHNLEKIITNNKRVTTNQVELLEKLIEKYQRQLNKHKLFITELLGLKWETLIVKTTEEYTSAHIGITNNDIILKTPYNKGFISVFKTLSQACFVWDHTNRYYIGPLSTHSLKLAINTITKFFNEVRYSNNVKQLLSDLEQYNNTKYWSPTLVYCNGNYLIACANEALDGATKDLQLNNSSKTLAELVRCGVSISDDIVLTDEERFASSFYNKIELNNICDIIPYLQNIGCDFVSLQGILTGHLLFPEPNSLFHMATIQNTLKEQLNLVNIKSSINNDSYTIANLLLNYKFPVVINFRNNNKTNSSKNLAKIINVVNSNPVNLRKTNNETM